MIKSNMAKIIEINGNIFESSCQTIVNTVNCEGVMGRGLALQFKLRYPEMFKSYENLCKIKQLQPGVLQLWKNSKPWILNFPTKKYWKFPSKISFIEFGLQKFSEGYIKNEITSIAFPELGSSLGGLDWNIVKQIMYKYLLPLKNLEVEIYHYDPRANDSLANKFLGLVKRFEVIDYKNIIGLSNKVATLLIEKIQEEKIYSMTDIQNIKGLGEKSLEKIYKFLNDKRNNRIYTENEKMPKLF